MPELDLKLRTKAFAVRIVRLCRKLPQNREGRLIGNQLFRSGTSVAANYRAATRARSRKEFIAKLGIVLEEADETLFWMELLAETGVVEPEKLDLICQENRKILAIVVAAINTARLPQRSPK